MNLELVSKTIKAEIDTIVNTVLNATEANSELIEFSFNTKKLWPYYKGCPEAYDNEFFIKLFTQLNTIKSHCLYWFEIEQIDKCQDLIRLQNEYRNTKNDNKNYRTIPAKALKGYDCSNSKTLYLGVRRGKGEKFNQDKTNIARRINQHLGYYKTNATQGLQLSTYATNEDIDITLKIHPLKGLDKDYLNLVEKALARRLNPHCGRH